MSAFKHQVLLYLIFFLKECSTGKCPKNESKSRCDQSGGDSQNVLHYWCNEGEMWEKSDPGPEKGNTFFAKKSCNERETKQAVWQPY